MSAKTRGAGTARRSRRSPSCKYQGSGDLGGIVLYRKGLFEDITVAVTTERDVFALGVVEGDAGDFTSTPGALQLAAQKERPPIFGGRYEAVLAEGDLEGDYFRRLLDYIHLNLVSAVSGSE